ncbi:MAG TPA: class I SAM-dependent methyltransferase [bacterium]|jgi:predicted O-methyltransferase YrrM
MNGEQIVNASIRAIIEEAATRASEEDLERVPELERFRVVSYEAGLFAFIIARSTRRKRIGMFDGKNGTGSIAAWLAGGVVEHDGSIFGWETNPRRHVKLQNMLARADLGHLVRLGHEDPLRIVEELEMDEFSRGEPFDMFTLSLLDLDWQQRIELGWKTLDSNGIFLLTDSFQAGDAAKKALEKFFGDKGVAAVGLNIGEGITFGLKLDDLYERIEKLPNSIYVGEKVAERMHFLEEGNRDRSNQYRAILPVLGLFLWMITKTERPINALEIGTSSGYSGSWIASGLKRCGGHLTTIDWDPAKISLANETFEIAGLENYATVIHGNALDILPIFEGKFDYIFLDCDKEFYTELIDVVVPMMNPGAVMIADNILSHKDELKSFVDSVQNNPNLVSVSLGLGKGVEMSMRL